MANDLTTTEAAALLGVHPRTIRYYCASMDPPMKKHGKAYVIPSIEPLRAYHLKYGHFYPKKRGKRVYSKLPKNYQPKPVEE